jgi:formate hydrogenlyase subunit 3/multisubunit Na+/H+ antiporter MnhD subunit
MNAFVTRIIDPDLSIILLLIAPLSAALVSLFGKITSKKVAALLAFLLWFSGTVWALFSSIGPIFCGGTLRYTFGGWAEPYGIVLGLNGTGWIAGFTILALGSAALLHTYTKDEYGPLFYSLIYLAFFSLQGITFTKDLFNLFVWFEILSLCSFVLIGYDHKKQSLTAALQYLFISSVSIVFFLLGVWVLYQYSGSLSLQTISQKLSDGSLSGRPLRFAVAAISAGMLTRSAIFPFHSWLPPAHASAPYPVSAVLSGFIIKAPVFALYHFTEYVPLSGVKEFIIWIGAAGALTGGLGAVLQTDAKRVLGYSSVATMGYIMAVFGMGGAFGKTAVLYSILAHAFSKGLLFLVVGETTQRVGSRDINTVRGLGRLYPLQAALFLIGACSIVGVPFFAGYGAKQLVFHSLFHHAAGIVFLLAGVGTAAALWRIGVMFTGTPPVAFSQKTSAQSKPLNRLSSAGGSLLLASGCVLLGLFPAPLSRVLSALGTAGPVREGGLGMEWYSPTGIIKSAVTVGTALLLALLLSRSFGRKAERKWSLFRIGITGSLRLLVFGSLLFFLLAAFL